MSKSKIICLCGSTKFKEEFEYWNHHFTLEGYIVLAPGVFAHSSGETLSEKDKEDLDKLHKAKIDLADEVFIIDKDSYIGDSTFEELKYASRKRKPIDFLTAHHIPDILKDNGFL